MLYGWGKRVRAGTLVFKNRIPPQGRTSPTKERSSKGKGGRRRNEIKLEGERVLMRASLQSQRPRPRNHAKEARTGTAVAEKLQKFYKPLRKQEDHR